MQAIGMAKPPVGVIFDADLGNHIDGPLAMALLYGLDGKEQCRVVSTSVSKSSLRSAALAEVIARFYSGTVNAAFASAGRLLPVGMSVEGKSPADTPMLAAVLDRKDEAGNPVYSHGIQRLVDTAEVPSVIRNAYSSQHDENCITVLAGPATNLVSILQYPGVKELVARKCKYLVWAAGSFAPAGKPDPRMTMDLAAAKKLFAEWPTPIVMAPIEVGTAIKFPAAAIETDFAWAANHPVVDAYRAFAKMPYDASTTAMAAVLYGVKPQEELFKLSDSGTISVGPDGRTKFTAGADGKHRYLIVDPAKSEQVLKMYRELASAKPVERRPRRRPPVAAPKKEEKPAEVKPPAEASKP